MCVGADENRWCAYPQTAGTAIRRLGAGQPQAELSDEQTGTDEHPGMESWIAGLRGPKAHLALTETHKK